MSAPPKKRLDLLISELGLVKSRQRARAMIMAGKVLVNNCVIDKPGTLIDTGIHASDILIKGDDIPYVSRGGIKLFHALDTYNIDPTSMICLDVGASTGGFTDCLLQNGAERVFAVDVGYGQLAWKIRQDPRVVIFERTNIRHLPLKEIPSPVDLSVIDVSFISLKIVVPAVTKFMKNPGKILALIKPQFEVGKGKVGKGGVVRDPALHDAVIQNLSQFFSENGLLPEPAVESPILGPKGNREFFVLLNFHK